jgi:outer membrane protein OmpA-like peptidoglycan-associated protein
VLQDSLGREFRTRPKSAVLQTKVIGRERRYYILANFAQSSAFYEFYWSNLIKSIPEFLKDPNVRICFSGHGCAIGSDAINEPLSKQRANSFRNNFLLDIQQQHPNLHHEITNRTDPPVGFGESKPLEFKTLSGKPVRLGDDGTPLGRQLNRRVMVLFYTPR